MSKIISTPHLDSTEWPEDLQQRSYFTGNFCGPDVNRACPGPEVAISRPGLPYLDADGELVPSGDGH